MVPKALTPCGITMQVLIFLMSCELLKLYNIACMFSVYYAIEFSISSLQLFCPICVCWPIRDVPYTYGVSHTCMGHSTVPYAYHLWASDMSIHSYTIVYSYVANNGLFLYASIGCMHAGVCDMRFPGMFACFLYIIGIHYISLYSSTAYKPQ